MAGIYVGGTVSQAEDAVRTDKHRC